MGGKSWQAEEENPAFKTTHTGGRKPHIPYERNCPIYRTSRDRFEALMLRDHNPRGDDDCQHKDADT